MAVDLILKNGLIADGTGADAYRGDVAIAAGRIAGVGRVNETARRVLDISGLVVAPGFWTYIRTTTLSFCGTRWRRPLAGTGPRRW